MLFSSEATVRVSLLNGIGVPTILQ